jgi:SAM-dependent methyltransferase
MPRKAKAVHRTTRCRGARPRLEMRSAFVILQAVKVSESIAKLGQPLTYRRAWRRIRRILHPIPLGPLFATIDQKRLGVLQAKYGSLPPDAPPLWRHYSKYLDLKSRLPINIRRAQDLNLQSLPPQEIMDIGCGGGFFLFVAQALGHHGLGLDVAGIPVFDGLIELLGIERRDLRITAFERLPDFGWKFDLITAFATAFHGGKEDAWRWGAREWDFFISDLEGQLMPGGRIFFELNAAYDGKYFTPDIREVFLQHGGIVERGSVLFRPSLGLAGKRSYVEA